MNLFIKGMVFDDLEVGLKYQWEIIKSNAVSYSWDLGNGTVSTNKIIDFHATKEEKRKVCVNVSINGWFNISKCYDLNIKNNFAPSLNVSEIVTFSKEVLISNEDEIINGRNYGKLLKIGTNIWLSKDVYFPSIYFYSFEFPLCPLGFR